MSIPNTKTVHIGKNIERIRESIGMKQKTLAQKLGISQQSVSQMEASESLDEAKLKDVADALGTTVEGLINYREDGTVNNISNTYNNNDSSVNSIFYYNIGNPEEVKQGYERLLASEQEKNKLIQEKNDLMKDQIEMLKQRIK